MRPRIAVIAGDGIGPEVIAQALRVLSAMRERGVDVDVWQLPLGAELYLKDGTTFPLELRDEVKRTCRAVLLGAVGDPRVPCRAVGMRTTSCSTCATASTLTPTCDRQSSQRRAGAFEPVHGSAPDIAGRDLANPLGAIRSLGMLLDDLGHAAEAERIERAAAEVLRLRRCTPDVGGTLGTTAAGSAFLDVLSQQ